MQPSLDPDSPLLPPPSDSFSAPYGYFENLPNRTVGRLHAEVYPQAPSPLWRLRWAGWAVVPLILVVVWLQFNRQPSIPADAGATRAVEAALFELPEAERIEYLLANSPTPDPDWLASNPFTEAPILEPDLAEYIIENGIPGQLPSELEIAWGIETELNY